MLSLLLYLVTVSIFAGVFSARILAVFPTPSVSHQVVFRPLTQELIKRGHEVVVITTDPAFPKDQAPKNLTEIDVHDVSYKIWRESYIFTSTINKEDTVMIMDAMLISLLEICLKQIEAEEIQKIVHNKNGTFDLVLIEAWVRPALLFTHLYKVPTIQISSFSGFFGSYETVGAPIHPLIYPLSSRQRLVNLTFWEKISELENFFVMDSVNRFHEKVENEGIWRLFGNDVPTLSELSKNVDMLLLNMHPILDGSRPVPLNVVYMGGVHRKLEKDLPTVRFFCYHNTI